MSLGPLNLLALKTALAQPQQLACSSRRVISLGYPDILANPAQIAQVFGESILPKLSFREDSAKILRWHGSDNTDRVAEASSLFAALGFELDVIDIVAGRGGEIICDLNHPIDPALHARYAAVIDAGTLEHCFNIGVAAKNVASLVSLGGVVMHGNPVNMYNHGFYNLNPLWYHEFYGANGFQLEFAALVNGTLAKPNAVPAPLDRRFSGIAENTVMVAIARRTELREIVFPTQMKYQMNPKLQA